MDDYRGKLEYPVADELLSGETPISYSRITRDKVNDPFWEKYKYISRDARRADGIRRRLLRRR